MRLLHLIPDFNFGGTEMLVRHLSKTQSEKGEEVKVVGFADEPGPLIGTFGSAINIPVASASLSLRNPPKCSDNFQKFLRDFKPDIIHSHSAWTDMILASVRGGDFAQVSHFHLLYDFYEKQRIHSIRSLKREAARHLLLHRQAQRNVQYIACSYNTAEYYAANLPVSMRGRLHVLENFNRIPSRNGPKPAPDTSSVLKILVVSRLVPKKNIYFSVEVLEALTKELKINASLIIAGQGPLERDLKNFISSKRLEDCVTFLGSVDNLVEVYDSADVLLHSALEETFGLVLVEAMARGVPCFANEDLPTAQTIFGKAKAGRIISLTDAGKVAKEIVKVCFNENTYEQLSLKSIIRSSDFNVEKYLKSLHEIYTKARSGGCTA